MRSMTGFGTCSVTEQGRHVRAEIRTVNHRFLDISVHTPRILAPFEQDMRQEIKRYMARGHVEVWIVYSSDVSEGSVPLVDMARVEALVKAAERITSATGCVGGLTAAQLLQTDDVLSFEVTADESDIAGALALSAVGAACRQVLAAREEEGKQLWTDVLHRVSLLEMLVERIAEREPYVVREYAERLHIRVRELTGEAGNVDPQRIAQEIAIFADRCNVTEEVVRIRSHLSRIRAAETGSEAQGRGLDFIAQELNREFNTIGSKSQDQILTDSVLDAKSEVEKIREQIQNIE